MSSFPSGPTAAASIAEHPRNVSESQLEGSIGQGWQGARGGAWGLENGK